jgi:small-conductance mechanosensitive channel
MDKKQTIFSSPPLRRVFISNLIGGIGWVVGIAIGLTFLGLFLSTLVASLGGLPYIGEQIAEIISVTSDALLRTQN